MQTQTIRIALASFKTPLTAIVVNIVSMIHSCSTTLAPQVALSTTLAPQVAILHHSVHTDDATRTPAGIPTNSTEIGLAPKRLRSSQAPTLPCLPTPSEETPHLSHQHKLLDIRRRSHTCARHTGQYSNKDVFLMINRGSQSSHTLPHPLPPPSLHATNSIRHTTFHN